MHKNHKVLEVFDEESLKKENISIEESIKEFDKYTQKVNDLKNKIEKEIKDINNLYEKTLDDLNKSYKKKHDILTQQENDLKEKLQNEVTKAKEKLEIFLTNTNNEIKISEKINKGIKKLEKEEKNMINILAYVSKINKNKKGMNSLFQELMNGLKFNYQENENNIKFEEYYFNGAPIPYDIEYKEITFIDYSNIELSWKINENIINFDNNKIKYKVEIKKENEQYNQVYEGQNQNCIINNLKNDSNYDIRICSNLNNVYGLWSEVKTIKTNKSIDSTILSNCEKKNEYLKKIYEWSQYKSMELLFRGTRDGMYSKNFHEKCDNKGPTITLLRNDKGNIMGGFSPISWTCEGGYHRENNCFIFTLSNIYNYEPTKFKSKNNGNEVYHTIDNGPCFYDIWIRNDFVNNTEAYFSSKFQDTYGKGNSMFTGNTDNNNRKITLNEVEVYKLYK